MVKQHDGKRLHQTARQTQSRHLHRPKLGRVVIDLDILKAQANVYNARLDKFVAKNRLPQSWFDQGYDHVAVKAYNLEDYRQIIEQFKVVSDRITEADLNHRQIATARLMGQFALGLDLSVGPYVYLRNVEIMLARPNDQSQDLPVFDHSEIFVPRGLMPIRKVLDEKKIQFLPQSNKSHEWVSVVFDDDGDEVKFTDRTLEDIVEENIASGKARIIYGSR